MDLLVVILAIVGLVIQLLLLIVPVAWGAMHVKMHVDRSLAATRTEMHQVAADTKVEVNRVVSQIESQTKSIAASIQNLTAVIERLSVAIDRIEEKTREHELRISLLEQSPHVAHDRILGIQEKTEKTQRSVDEE